VTAQCAKLVAVGAVFVVEYRPLGVGTTNESIAAIFPDGALLFTNTDPNHSMSGLGTAGETGVLFAKPVSLTGVTTLLISAVPSQAPPIKTIIGTANNVSIAGCTVAFAAGIGQLAGSF
jgi:hypothetical protein